MEKYPHLFVLLLGVIMTLSGVAISEENYRNRVVEVGTGLILGAGFAGDWSNKSNLLRSKNPPP